MTPYMNRNDTIAREEALQKGLLTTFPAGAPLTLHGEDLTPDTAAAMLQRRIDTFKAVDAAHAAWKSALLAAEAEHHASDAMVASLEAIVLAMYTPRPEVLQEFGLSPRKPRRKATVDELRARAAKAAATRVARGTLGPKQRAKIKGVVPAPTPAAGSPPTLLEGPPVPRPPPLGRAAAAPSRPDTPQNV